MTRLDKAKAKLMSCDFDAIYITSEINQRYITDFNFSDGSVLITKEKSYVLTDFRYIEAARAKVKGDFEILTPNRRENYLLDLCRTAGEISGKLTADLVGVNLFSVHSSVRFTAKRNDAANCSS